MTDESIGLNEAYSVQSPEDNKKLYDKWAKTYESEFVNVKKYRYPKAIAELFHEKIPEVESLVDIGTGTGLVGLYLSKLRPKLTIDGIDISPAMLEEARSKNVYRNLFERDLTKEVTDTAAPYDALISSGTFTHGHLGPEAILNLLPLVKVNGYFVIGANNEHFEAKHFKAFIESLHGAEKISTPVFQKIQVYEEGSPHYGDRSVVTIFNKTA